MSEETEDNAARHKRKMQNQKEKVDAKIAASDEERGCDDCADRRWQG